MLRLLTSRTSDCNAELAGPSSCVDVVPRGVSRVSCPQSTSSVLRTFHSLALLPDEDSPDVAPDPDFRSSYLTALIWCIKNVFLRRFRAQGRYLTKIRRARDETAYKTIPSSERALRLTIRHTEYVSSNMSQPLGLCPALPLYVCIRSQK